MRYTSSLAPVGDERGMVMVIIAIALTMILGFTGLAVDSIRVHNANESLQAAIDSAALAAAIGQRDGGPSQARVMAAQYAAKNTANGYPVSLANEDLELGNWDPKTHTFTPVPASEEASASAIRVIGRLSSARGNPVSLPFMSVLGRNNADVITSATATFGGGLLDMVVLQDVTGSFKNELNQALIADHLLLDCLNERADPDSLFGIDVFTGVATEITPMRQIATDYNQLNMKLNTIQPCGQPLMPKCSGTNQAAGLRAAVDTLKATPPSGARAHRAIVMVSDGEPSCSKKSGSCTSNSQIIADANRVADEAAALDISIFSIYYSGNGAAGSAFLEGLVRGDGFFIAEPQAAALSNALREVCFSMPARLVD